LKKIALLLLLALLTVIKGALVEERPQAEPFQSVMQQGGEPK